MPAGRFRLLLAVPAACGVGAVALVAEAEATPTAAVAAATAAAAAAANHDLHSPVWLNRIECACRGTSMLLEVKEVRKPRPRQLLWTLILIFVVVATIADVASIVAAPALVAVATTH